MTASNTALLVIDVQESFRHRPYWRDEDVSDFISRQQALIDGAKAAGHAVVQIFHTDDDAEFRLDSGFVRTLAGLRIEPDVVIHKTRHSAFVGTPLEIGAQREIADLHGLALGVGAAYFRRVQAGRAALYLAGNPLQPELAAGLGAVQVPVASEPGRQPGGPVALR